MRAVIIFYSFSGKTRNACRFLAEKLSGKDIAADFIELKPQPEETSFFKQAQQAFLKKTPQLQSCNYDLAVYNAVILASPVWAFTIAPALRSYLLKISDFGNKKAACLVTHGSGTGSAKALKELENILREKHANVVFSANISGNKTRDDGFLNIIFKDLPDVLK